MKRITACFAWCAVSVLGMHWCEASTARRPGKNDLVIANAGKGEAVVIVSPAAGEKEEQAAADLVKYIEMMCGSRPALADSDPAIKAALAGTKPLLLVGQKALELRPKLSAALDAVLKKQPLLRNDGIVLHRDGRETPAGGQHDHAPLQVRTPFRRHVPPAVPVPHGHTLKRVGLVRWGHHGACCRSGCHRVFERMLVEVEEGDLDVRLVVPLLEGKAAVLELPQQVTVVHRRPDLLGRGHLVVDRKGLFGVLVVLVQER
jgi:hypothetical protein